MEDKAAYVHHLFSAIAGKYDLHNTLLSFNRDSYWRRFAASKAGVRGGERALDVATIGLALRNVTDIERTLQEMTRVIKRGGKVVCLEFAPPRHRLFQKIYRFYLFTILPF